MFKKATLRFFAGMLFGSTAGVFLGVGFAAVASSHLPNLPELDKMNDLLRQVMWGAFFGLFFGGFVALGRKPLHAGFASAALAVLAMYLSVALVGPASAEIAARLGIGAAAMFVGAMLGELGGRWFARLDSKAGN